jgi:SLT domain-containing protein
LYNLWQGESGWNNNAQNPTSTAYGIAQFLNSTWGGTGIAKTSNPASQIEAGLRYIQGAYGTPANAYSKWLSRSPHWYGDGLAPTVFSQPTVIGVGERGPEIVSVTPRNSVSAGGNSALVAELRAMRRDLAKLPIAVVDGRYVRRSLENMTTRDPNGW